MFLTRGSRASSSHPPPSLGHTLLVPTPVPLLGRPCCPTLAPPLAQLLHAARRPADRPCSPTPAWPVAYLHPRRAPVGRSCSPTPARSQAHLPPRRAPRKPALLPHARVAAGASPPPCVAGRLFSPTPAQPPAHLLRAVRPPAGPAPSRAPRGHLRISSASWACRPALPRDAPRAGHLFVPLRLRERQLGFVRFHVDKLNPLASQPNTPRDGFATKHTLAHA